MCASEIVCAIVTRMHATGPSRTGVPAIARDRVAYTIEGAAEQLSLSVRKVKSLIKSGELRSVKVGRARRVWGADLDEFMAERAA
jgi:excisionase family DNA binding protein